MRSCAKWVPRIEASPAYQQDGALIVTFDESESGAEGCCVQDHPNTPNAGGQTPGPGGGRTGTVVVSRYVAPGTTSDTPYNHYSLLRTIEDIFGLSPLGYAGRSTHSARMSSTAPPPRRRRDRAARHGSRAAARSLAARSSRAWPAQAEPSTSAWLTPRTSCSRPTGAASQRAARAPARPWPSAAGGARSLLIKATVRDARELRTVTLH